MEQSAASPKKAAPADHTTKPSVDISGTWSLVATFTAPPGMPTGGFSATLTFKQRGDTFDGYITFPTSRGGPFSGTVKDKAVAFTITLKNPDHRGVVDTTAFTGTVVDAKTIKGYVKSESKGPGTDMGAEGPYVATRR